MHCAVFVDEAVIVSYPTRSLFLYRTCTLFCVVHVPTLISHPLLLPLPFFYPTANLPVRCRPDHLYIHPFLCPLLLAFAFAATYTLFTWSLG